MENNTKQSENKKGRFNIVDALIVIVILAIAAGLLWITDPFSWFSEVERTDVKLRYVVEIKSIDDDLAMSIKKIKFNQTALNSSGSIQMGKVQSVKTAESTVWEYDKSRGEMVQKTVEGKIDVYFVIDSDCVYEKGVGYLLGNNQIAVGSPVGLRFPDFVGSGYCVSIEVFE